MDTHETRMVEELFEKYLIHAAKDQRLKGIVSNVVHKIYAVDRFYVSHIVKIVPQTTKQLLQFTDNPESHVTWYKGVSSTKPIQLFLNIDASDETVIWDLIHEYGHLVDGPPSLEVGNQLHSLPRELRAWKIGQMELTEHPEFLVSYIRRMDECLMTYP